jgi:AGCS family alanine or glycine:cation symporter
MAHAAAKTREPVSEGLVGMMEPLIDTVIVCTITALVIIISGQHVLRLEGVEGIALTSAAFTSIFPWFDWVLMVAVLLFGFSTVISWAYYTEKIWTYVLGDSRRVIHSFRIFYCLLLIPGGALTPTQVFDIIDSLFFLLALPNIIGLYIMMPEVKADLKDYLARLKSGKIAETGTAATSPAE